MKQLIKQLWFDFKYHLKNRDFIWKYKIKIFKKIFILLLILDFVTKQLIFNLLSHDIESFEIKFIDKFINFKFIINKGIAFGINSGNTIFIIIITIFIIIIIFNFILYINNKTAIIGLFMIIAGGIGNLIDRIWNYGGVIDFLTWLLFPPYSIFNLADIWITFGIIILFFSIIIEIFIFYYKQIKNNRKKNND